MLGASVFRRQGKPDLSFADRFAGVFARRAAQAQAGDEPSARLTASAG